MTDRIQIYRSRGLNGRLQWRWRWVAGNGRKLATGGESYHNLEDLLHALERVTSLPIQPLEGPPDERHTTLGVPGHPDVQVEVLSYRPRRMSA